MWSVPPQPAGIITQSQPITIAAITFSPVTDTKYNLPPGQTTMWDNNWHSLSPGNLMSMGLLTEVTLMVTLLVTLLAEVFTLLRPWRREAELDSHHHQPPGGGQWPGILSVTLSTFIRIKDFDQNLLRNVGNISRSFSRLLLQNDVMIHTPDLMSVCELLWSPDKTRSDLDINSPLVPLVLPLSSTLARVSVWGLPVLSYVLPKLKWKLGQWPDHLHSQDVQNLNLSLYSN